MEIHVFTLIRENRIRALKTFALLLSFVAIGLYESSIGPSLLDFQLAVNTSTPTIAWLMPACMLGYIIGSFLIGFLLYPYVNPFLCDFFCFIFSAVFTPLIPYNRTLVGLLSTAFVNGIALGTVDAIGNITVLLLWGKECEPFMQLLHFAFGLGAIFGPLIAGPFLLPIGVNDRMVFLHINKSMAYRSYTVEHLKFQKAYLIIAIFMVCISALYLYIFMYHRHTSEHPSRFVTNTTDINAFRLNQTVYKIVICLGILFIHIYYGVELAIGTYMTTFVVYSDLKLSKETGADITAVYWGTVAFFQLAAVFYIHKIGAEKNIIFELIVIMLGNCFLIPFGNVYEWSLWVGAGVTGIGMSAIWASLFGFFENYFPVSNKVAAMISISACVGEFIVPNIMGLHIEETPTVFLWVILSYSVTTCILFTVLNWLCKTRLINKSPS